MVEHNNIPFIDKIITFNLVSMWKMNNILSFTLFPTYYKIRITYFSVVQRKISQNESRIERDVLKTINLVLVY